MTQHTHRPRPSYLVTLGLAAAVATGGVVGLAPAPSYAESTTVTDPAGDPVRFADDGTSTSAPVARTVDATSTRLDYRRHALVVRVSAVRAAKDVVPIIFVRSRGTDQVFYNLAGTAVEGDGGRCAGGVARVDGDRETYTVRIPARCFGTPDAVRVGVGLTRLVGDEKSDDVGYVADDVQRAGLRGEDQDPRLSRALARA